MRVFTQEHKDNISKATKGIKKSEEHNKKNSESQKGRVKSEEECKNISESKKGHKGTTTGREIWNNGERNFFISPDQKPEVGWKRGMVKRKKT